MNNAAPQIVEGCQERAGYLELSGTHLYGVLHGTTAPAARMLLVGPFGSERHYSYIPWVRWARFLATRGIEALRYDYRGTGESGGVFAEMTFDDWCDDVSFLAGWLNARSSGLPLILHGLELGAILASKIFASGVGDALLTWAAPQNVNEVLRAAILRRMAIDRTFNGSVSSRPFSEYVERLDTEPLESDGYQLSGKLWRESLKFEVPAIVGHDGRPMRRISLDKRVAPLVKGSTLGYLSINPDLSELFTDNFDWITTEVLGQK